MCVKSAPIQPWSGFHVLDPDELNFPFHGTCRFVGLEADGDLTTQPIPVVPAAHYMCGGIAAKADSTTAKTLVSSGGTEKTASAMNGIEISLSTATCISQFTSPVSSTYEGSSLNCLSFNPFAISSTSQPRITEPWDQFSNMASMSRS